MSVPTIDGTPVSIAGLSGAGPHSFAAFSATGPGKVIIAGLTNGGTGILSVSDDGPGLSFTDHANNGQASRAQILEADFSSSLSSVTFSITTGAGTSNGTVVVFAVSGEDGFDADASTPSVGDTTDSGVDPTIDTDASDTMVIGNFRYSTGTPATPSGWTVIHASGALGTFYKTFTSPQTTLTVDSGASTQNGWAVTALAGPSSGPVEPFISCTVYG